MDRHSEALAPEHTQDLLNTIYILTGSTILNVLIVLMVLDLTFTEFSQPQL